MDWLGQKTARKPSARTQRTALRSQIAALDGKAGGTGRTPGLLAKEPLKGRLNRPLRLGPGDLHIPFADLITQTYRSIGNIEL